MKRIKTKIDKQKIKRIMVYFSCQRRAKKGKKLKKFIDDNPTTILRHVPLLIEKDMIAHLKKILIYLG
jgi:hypothetical protein